MINATFQTLLLCVWSDPGQGDSFGIRLWCEQAPVVVCGLAVLGTYRRWFVGIAMAIAVGWTTLHAVLYIMGGSMIR